MKAREEKYNLLVKELKNKKLTINDIYYLGISPYLFKKFLEKMKTEGLNIRTEIQDGKKYFWVENEVEYEKKD